MSVDSVVERMSARETGPALEAHYRFLLWLVPAVERFPRRQKFLPGDRIQTTALDVLDSLVEATYTRRRGAHLARANLGIEKLRFLFRLAHDLRFLDPRRYEHSAKPEPTALRRAHRTGTFPLTSSVPESDAGNRLRPARIAIP